MANLRARIERTYQTTRHHAQRLLQDLTAPEAPPIEHVKPNWRATPNLLPWFDQPTAPGTIERWRREGTIDAAEAEILYKWIADGYVVVDGYVHEPDLDEMTAVLDGIWESSSPIPGLVVHCRLEGAALDLTHEQLLALPAEGKAKIKQAGWRFNSSHTWCSASRRIFNGDKLRALVTRLFGLPAEPQSSLNFMQGSRQSLHQDMAVFHIHPNNFLIGAWIACEDVLPDAGPLVLCPGSHREPMFGEFWDYPQTNLHTASPEVTSRYQAYVDGLAQKYERKHFLARKGQVLLWHGMLIHGGETTLSPERTRKSLVIHYSVPGTDRREEIVGPFSF